MPYRLSHLLLLAMYAGLILIKMPGVLVGRLWAEDGFFLVDALRLPWWQVLTTQHTGYIDVTASIGMLLATRLASLEDVPLFTVGWAFAVQLLPAILLLTSRSAWLETPYRYGLALLLIVLPPFTEEIWLNPVTSQYHLMLCVGLILAFEGINRRVSVFQCVVLAVAGLSGPGPVLATPLFALRAVIERSWFRGLQAVILTIGALIELKVFLTYPVPTRELNIGLTQLSQLIYFKHFQVPLFGTVVAEPQSLWLAGVVIAGLIGLGYAAVCRGPDTTWLFAGCVVMMVFSYLGALSKTSLLVPLSGQRYYYAPQVLLGLTLLGIACTGSLVGRRIASVFVVWLLLVGCRYYFEVSPAMASGPSWREQIAEWRTNPDQPITLWPKTFAITLPEVDRR